MPAAVELPSSVAPPGHSTTEVRDVILNDLWSAVGAALQRGWTPQDPPHADDYAKAVDVIVHLAETGTLDQSAADAIMRAVTATMLHDEFLETVKVWQGGWVVAAGGERRG